MGDVKKMISVLIAAGLQQEQTSPPSTRAAIFPKWAKREDFFKRTEKPPVSQPAFLQGTRGENIGFPSEH
jgi:hypothetical protein